MSINFFTTRHECCGNRITVHWSESGSFDQVEKLKRIEGRAIKRTLKGHTFYNNAEDVLCACCGAVLHLSEASRARFR